MICSAVDLDFKQFGLSKNGHTKPNAAFEAMMTHSLVAIATKIDYYCSKCYLEKVFAVYGFQRQ